MCPGGLPWWLAQSNRQGLVIEVTIALAFAFTHARARPHREKCEDAIAITSRPFCL